MILKLLISMVFVGVAVQKLTGGLTRRPRQ
jgi:hypothetical protein